MLSFHAKELGMTCRAIPLPMLHDDDQKKLLRMLKCFEQTVEEELTFGNR